MKSLVVTPAEPGVPGLWSFEITPDSGAVVNGSATGTAGEALATIAALLDETLAKAEQDAKSADRASE